MTSDPTAFKSLAGPSKSLLRFASLVNELSPLSPTYLRDVQMLQAQHNDRERLTLELSKVEIDREKVRLGPQEAASLSRALRSTISQWVVDNRP